MIRRVAPLVALLTGACTPPPATPAGEGPPPPGSSAPARVGAGRSPPPPAPVARATTTTAPGSEGPPSSAAPVRATPRLALSPPAGPGVRFALRQATAAAAAILVADTERQNVMVRDDGSKRDLDLIDAAAGTALERIAASHGLTYASHDGWHVLAPKDAIERWTARRGRPFRQGPKVSLELYHVDVDAVVHLLLPLVSATERGHSRATVSIWARAASAGGVLTLLCALDACGDEKPGSFVFVPGPAPSPSTTGDDPRATTAVALRDAPLAALRLVGVALADGRPPRALITDGSRMVVATTGTAIGRDRYVATAIDATGIELSPVPDP